HDCGKITTPEYVVDKGTKLETIYDRVNEIDMRVEVLRRDAIINFLKAKLKEFDNNNDIDMAIRESSELQSQLEELENARRDVRQYNVGGESLQQTDIERIEHIAEYTWQDAAGETRHLLDDEEKQNLEIGRGTLTMREREIINNHVSVSIKMLESLPYPKHLRRVPEFAGGHHEKIDGTGYPNKLTGDQMSLQARIVAIADVFEALTASDRPYKKAMPLSQSLQILGQMKVDKHIDGDLFDIFINEKIYLDYAAQFLEDSQVDDINFDAIPGYTPL
ncbi:MAG: HD domain-containing phosphohydrolase, partial [Gammaproteobacteria bacterium]